MPEVDELKAEIWAWQHRYNELEQKHMRLTAHLAKREEDIASDMSKLGKLIDLIVTAHDDILEIKP